ncbi:MAG: hypothetical protein SH847_12475 [Roseiflexaceae bacterium]|nr:hypothetical protein [Roseiflexaceae bacterium]
MSRVYATARGERILPLRVASGQGLAPNPESSFVARQRLLVMPRL